MGAMPFSEFFKARRDGSNTPEAETTRAPVIDRAAKTAIVQELETAAVTWFWATDVHGHVVYLSPAIEALVERAKPDGSGMPLQELLKPVQSDGDSRSLGLRLRSHKSFQGLIVELAGDKGDLVMKLSGRPLFDDAGEFAGFRGSAIDITDAFRAEEEAARLAQFDSLTGLANRHRMEHRIGSTLQAFRNAKRNCALLMLDLDRFKAVNDTLGHAAGDQLLQQVAERLKAAINGRGEIGRLGGDEFQVLIPDMDDRGELGAIAKRVIQMLSQPYSVEEGRCTIGCSVGIAIAPYDGIERDELTRAADLALYASKNGGRGQFRFYASDLEHEAQLRKRMEQDLSDAIEAGHFRLEYQPLVELSGNRVIALEAQYCWKDEERGRVDAATFLPVAEGSRLIVPIGEWGLRTACTDARNWPDSVRLAMKVSAVQFGSNGFAGMVMSILEETGLEPRRLELLIDEAVLQGDPAAIDKTMAELFKADVRLSLDRFGTGFTSLAYLRRAPFAGLRIGANFFEPTVGDEHGDMEMVGAIVSLARAMAMETYASGVHALSLLEKLKTHGVGTIQGHVFSQPLSSTEVATAITGGEWTIAPTDSGNQRAGRRTVFRRIGLIHEDHYYDVTLRNLSRSGAMIQGIEGVSAGTQFVLDFGGGQLAVCTVRRAMDDTQGVEFEHELVDDGAGGLCTRHRVSPYALAAAGAPLAALPAGRYAMDRENTGHPQTYPQFKLSSNAPVQVGPNP
ncbi:putative bifunctional diguanylate cyclase/phosphodiesterase [Qipengyuania sp. MTN3-11]|uniref:putative bifunctional diguanylate cyclase/phosphodiesterase n=1 Tax=Qipengyuania sp. MTN3-11 TaxID=3056557 RepID=UPI0036F1EA0C